MAAKNTASPTQYCFKGPARLSISNTFCCWNLDLLLLYVGESVLVMMDCI